MSIEANTSRTASQSESYRDILKSTSIVGGSQAINYVIGMVRTKLVALLLGPDGVGLVGLFQSSIALVAQLTGMGIANSGVRQIAEATGLGDREYTGKTVRVLRRACWFTGILGWLITIGMARLLSVWAFNSAENALLVAVLGVTILLGAVSGGQKALIQGTRRIADLARMTVISALASTVVAIVIYVVYREQGIVPVLISTAAVNLGVSWWFARRVPVPSSSELTWSETYHEGKKLTNLGFAFMWSGILAALVDLGIRSVIVREVGLHGTGIYQAAWGLSGIFATFILTAMGADFYPRLTAVADNSDTVNAMVNEQIEIGSFIATPGLLASLACGPWLMTIFYSREFVEGGAELLPWFILGIYCRVVSWPVGFLFLAKGAAKWFAIAQTNFCAFNMLGAWILIKQHGLIGVGFAFALAFIPSGLLNLFVANRLTSFYWSPAVVRLMLINSCLIGTGFACSVFLSVGLNFLICVTLTCVTGIYSVREVTRRVGTSHRIVKTLLKIPGMRLILPK